LFIIVVVCLCPSSSTKRVKGDKKRLDDWTISIQNIMKITFTECWRARSTLLCALLVRDSCHIIDDGGQMSGGAIYTLGDAVGQLMSPM